MAKIMPGDGKKNRDGLLHRLSIIPNGFWVVILVIVLVGGRAFWNYAPAPAHLDAIAEEVGNVAYMVKNEGVWKNGKLQLNYAGNKILFCQSSEKGVGVFLTDVASGKKKMIFEEKEICFGQGPHGVLKVYPWSPDDRRFVYSHQGYGAQNGDYDCPNETVLSVYNADSGTEEATLEIPYGQVAELDWLSPDAFVSASGVNGQDFCLAERQTDGKWELRQLNKPVVGADTADDQFCSLAAVSSNTVAWLQGNCIWTMNVASEVVSKLIELPTDKSIKTTYTSFDYSKEMRQFLISCVDNKADTLWQLPLDDSEGLNKIASMRKRTHNTKWNDAIWINGAKEFAYIVPWSDSAGLVVQGVSGNDPVTLFPQKSIQYFTASPDGRHFYVVGDINDQPGADIWEYDAETKALRCAVPASEKPWQYSKYVEPQMISIKLSDKKPENVVIYPPASYDRLNHQKYPIVITCISYGAAQPYLTQYAEAVANAGAYFVDVDRPWNFRTPQDFINWEGHINDITSNLLATQTLTFDKNRMFVLSNSAQSIALMNVLTNHPGIYRGVICLVPAGELTKPSELEAGREPFKILVSTQEGSGGWLSGYQEEAWKSGMIVNYIIHPGTPHEFIAKQSQRERIQAMLHFIDN
jgi:hypothetical protein